MRKLPIAALMALMVMAGSFCPDGRAEASLMVPPPPYVPKDFALIKRDGEYHLFYIRRDTTLPFAQTENDFGHAVSNDLYTWTHLPPVMAVVPTSWDNSHVWAPDIVEHDGLYYMFYTGVSEEPGVYSQYQRIGVATSSDLMLWNRAPQPLLACTAIPSAACDPLNSAYGFRDPQVIVDPDDPAQFWLYFAMQSSSNPSTMVIGTAGSDQLLGGWSENGPLWVTHSSMTGSDLAESPHIMDHAGRWFLMWTGNGVQPVVYATAPSPLAPAAQWLYKGSLSGMLGIDTNSWFASEHLHDGKVDYFAAATAGAIEILRIAWQTDSTFTVTQPPLMHVTDMGWTSHKVSQGNLVNLTFDVVNPSGGAVAIEAHEIDVNGNETPIPNAQIGLPAAIQLTGTSTVYPWHAQRWNDMDDADSTDSEIRVRLADCTAQSPVLRVLPPLSPPSQGGPSVEPREQVGEGFLLRFLARSPLGPVLHLEMPEDGFVRLDVVDIQGRLVRRLAERAFPAGASVIQWDGRDARGGRLAAGVYFVTMRSGDAQHTARIAVTP